jgi:hypothetical protein
MRQSNPETKPFVPAILDKTVIAVPLLKMLKEDPDKVYSVIIDLNLEYSGTPRGPGEHVAGGRIAAKKRVEEMIPEAIDRVIRSREDLKGLSQGINRAKTEISQQYVFARLHCEVIRELVRLDEISSQDDPACKIGGEAATRAIYHIWPDFAIKGSVTRSICTVKADAARRSFSAMGQGIVWAVLDSGIDGNHPHFQAHQNLDPPAGLRHRDLTALDGQEQPLKDDYGHGTHVAGILAGELTPSADQPVYTVRRHRDENGDVIHEAVPLGGPISGMAPECKVLSLKVLDEHGQGEVSSLITAIELIQQMNGNGRSLRVHGANLSVGYDFEPEWFACGQSPVCVEVDRLVRSGVVVVVAAGNTGYGWLQTREGKPVAAGMDLTINDPGNAELAITVGSTHRDMPHVYGVSYFSSKGPTGDGRRKPDLVAPGEKILSAAAGQHVKELAGRVEAKLVRTCKYVEDSGTSMAAPHVSGVIAAFLSVRREYLGQPEAVKKLFLESATDLNRLPYFQGYGLVDLMRAIQSV